jgi:hypothetical protein
VSFCTRTANAVVATIATRTAIDSAPSRYCESEIDGPPNKLLAPILAAYPEVSKKFPATPEDLKQLKQINWPVFNKMLPEAVKLWNREIASKK